MNNRFLRKKDVLEKTGLSWATICRLEKADKFPARTKISERIIGWSEREIDQWINRALKKATA